MGKIFEYGLDAPQPGTLLLSAVAAFLYLFMVAGKPSARRTGVKTLSVALLAVLCVLVDGPLVLTLALLACAAGDAFLAHDDERAFLPGLLASSSSWQRSRWAADCCRSPANCAFPWQSISW